MKNEETVYGADAGRQLARAKSRADAAWKATQEAERAWIATATMRKPESWRQTIDGIADRTVRIQVACVVWWDFFGTRQASRAWKQLDDYKAEWRADRIADPKRVRAALIQIGYPMRRAAARQNLETEMRFDVCGRIRRSAPTDWNGASGRMVKK